MTRKGQLNLKQQKYKFEMEPIDKNCNCSTCKTYTRSYLHHIVNSEAVACSMLTVHNVAFQLRLMNDIRASIEADKYPEFVKEFISEHYEGGEVPNWIKDALKAVNVEL